MLIVVDLDGTVCDLTARIEAAGAEPNRSDREAFQEWLDKVQSDETLIADKPIYTMLKFLQTLEGLCYIIYLTGRSNKFEEVTRAWLAEHNFPCFPLFMRGPEHEWIHPPEYKVQLIKHLAKSYGNQVIVIDDDPTVCTAVKQEGWVAMHIKHKGNKE